MPQDVGASYNACLEKSEWVEFYLRGFLVNLET